uniref:type II toxin-antitoxin system PrlF family antitoxin n=1 Tax=Ningiella ruwaisensis TaxID=2364274 RepID=UPI00109FD359|nr:type II toxin-antitoxin system PrlF family antitoxin [Ningiella ruwaisensis]
MPQLPLQTETTLTERYQTTVPSVVRKALHLGKKDKIRFTVEPNGSVTLSRAEPNEDDPILNAFLSFLGNDIEQHPENIQALSPAMRASIQSLTEGVDIDLNAPLDENDD